MNRGTYTAATGMMAQQTRLDVLTNNLANANTRGFKADRVTFGELMSRTMADDAGYGAPIATLSAGPNAKVETVDFASGGTEHTGNPLDVRLNGDAVAMFAVQTAGGGRGYTRDGSFRLNADRQITTQRGEPVLDDGGQPITVVGDPEIKANGQVTVAGKPVATLGRFVGTFTKAAPGGNLYDSTDARSSDAIEVEPGALEAANVEPVSMMVEMISLQRAYELSQKMAQSQDESSAKLAEAMS